MKLSPVSTLLFSVFYLCAFGISTAFGGVAYPTLRETLGKYKDSNLVQMTVKKSVTSELMGKEVNYEGKIFISDGLFRWENSKPDQTLLVFDGKNLWNVQFPDPDFPGPVQVTKARVDKKNKSQLLLADLLGRAAFFESFDVAKLQVDKENFRASYTSEPKTNEINIKSLVLTVDTKAKTIQSISYKDDVGNVTVMNFSDIQFKSSPEASLFKYSPPKDAKVTNL